MATSESDDFESADEEMSARRAQAVSHNQNTYKKCIGSDSDDDVDYIPVQSPPVKSNKKYSVPSSHRSRRFVDRENEKSDEVTMDGQSESDKNKKKQNLSESSEESQDSTEKSKSVSPRSQERPLRQRKPKEASSLGAKKLGATKIEKFPDTEDLKPDEIRKTKISDDTKLTMSPPLKQECWEEVNEMNLNEELKKINEKEELEILKTEELSEEPEELMSNLKFKEIFKPDGWEGLGEDVELPSDLSDDKYHPVLDKLASQEDNSDGSWAGWGSWGMSSFINTATASVSTLTSHVSQGLTLLEESMGIPDPEDLVESNTPTEEKPKPEEKEKLNQEVKVETEEEAKVEEEDESPSQYLPSFGFGNFISSMSSIANYVESTSSKVISGGLDTLETLGKKTMEVLQEGDPGLKKKRAFFSNDADKPILSQILREAKEQADVAEKSIEEKELARKVHFESLFDDYQGLVHLEALEMLSKQCNMKIQQQLVNLDGTELTSMQETLDEVKELCDLGEEDDDDDYDDENDIKLKNKDLKEKLEEASKDLGITLTYDKLVDSWCEINSQFSLPQSKAHREIFQNAISSLAQFTAYSVERFHKTAELLLIKPRRSTVNEADSLVQLTKTLSSQIGSIANLFCNKLNEFKEETDKSEVNSSITTINLEAANASSYVQEAFRLLIPILQVGAI